MYAGHSHKMQMCIPQPLNLCLLLTSLTLLQPQRLHLHLFQVSQPQWLNLHLPHIYCITAKSVFSQRTPAGDEFTTCTPAKTTNLCVFDMADNELFRVLRGLRRFLFMYVCQVCTCGCYYRPQTHDLSAILSLRLSRGF